jgi:hypothetical protein
MNWTVLNSGQPLLAIAPPALRYDACGDAIFPSIIDAAACFARPFARYYLYYAPHSAPGGICLAFADSLAGPWTEHAGNPVIANHWGGHHDVDHVSSPHAIFTRDRSRLLLYYHGDNDATRIASSEDGVAFAYEGVALAAADSQSSSDSVSYARVFADPAQSGGFAMLYLAYRYVPGSWVDTVWHGLFVAHSPDGLRWRPSDTPLMTNADLPPGAFACSPFLLPWRGRLHVLYHEDRDDGSVAGGCVTDIRAFEVDAGLRRVAPTRLACPRTAFGDGNERASDPFPVVGVDEVRLFAAIGPRLRQRIASVTIPTERFLA